MASRVVRLTSDTGNRTVSPTGGRDAVLNNIIGTGTGMTSSTEPEPNGIETGTNEILALVNKLVNAYDRTNSNSK
jgi:hypothetical protein